MKKYKGFISYAHLDNKDVKVADIFINKFKQYGNNQLLDSWHDKDIPIGSNWFNEISDAIKECDFGIILISESFISSEFIKEHEYQVFIDSVKKGKINLFPILLSHVNFSSEHINIKWSTLLEKQIYKFNNYSYFETCLIQDNGKYIHNAQKDKYISEIVNKIKKQMDNGVKEIVVSDENIIEKKERSIKKTIELFVEKKAWSIKKEYNPVNDWSEKIIFELYLISQGEFGDDIYFLYFHESSGQKKTYKYLNDNKLYDTSKKLFILTEKPREKDVLNSITRLKNLKEIFETDNVFFIEDFAYKHIYSDYLSTDFFEYKKFEITNFIESFSIEYNDNKTAFEILNQWYITESEPLLVIEGYGGIGKSTLAKHFLDSIDDDNVAKLFIESKSIINEIIHLSEENDIDDIFNFYEAMTNKKSVNKILSQKLFQLSIDNGNLIIVLDGIDEIIARLGSKFNINSFLESISNNYSNDNGRCKIIITCRDYFWDKLEIKIKNIHLKPFNEQLAKKYFEKSFAKLTSQVSKAMKFANKFTFKHEEENEDIYIPYILDTIVYIINTKLRDDEDINEDKLIINSDYLLPDISNDYLIGSICEREIHKLGNINSIDKQLDFFIELAIDFGGIIKIEDLLKQKKDFISIIDNLKSHTILNTDENYIFFRYDFFNEYFKSLYIANYFKNKEDKVNDRILDTLVKYITYDNSLMENIFERIVYDEDLIIYCMDLLEGVNSSEIKESLKRDRRSGILKFLLVLLKKSEKQLNSENCTEIIENVFKNDLGEIEYLSIIDLYTNDKLKPIFNFSNMVFKHCYFNNYEYFWDCKVNEKTKFKNSTFKSLQNKNKSKIDLQHQQFIDCNIVEIEEVINTNVKNEDKIDKVKKALKKIFNKFYKNGNFYSNEYTNLIKGGGNIIYIKFLISKKIIIKCKNGSDELSYEVSSDYNDITKIFHQGNNSLKFNEVVKLVMDM